MLKIYCSQGYDKTKSYSQKFKLQVISGELNIPESEIKFELNQFNKPFVQGYLNFYFNVSHTHDMIVCAVSDSEVGVDIEKIKHASQKNEKNEKIVSRFFSENEQKEYFNSTDKSKCFFEIWTQKEAYLKKTGVGLGKIPLASFCTKNPEISKKLTTFEYAGYIISVCTDSKNKLSLICLNNF